MTQTQSKTVLILSRRDERPDFDTATSMVDRLQSCSPAVRYEACFLDEVGFVFDGKQLTVANTRNGKDLAGYDGIFLIGWFIKYKNEEAALAVSLYARHHGVPTMNSEALHNRSRGKLSQLVFSVLHGVSTTPYVVIADSERAPQLVDESGLQYPLIAKSATGSRGNLNFLVHDRDELIAALASAPSKAFVIQTFVPNDGDYRVLVIGGQVRMVIHRKSAADSHLNNTSQGGAASLVDPATLPMAIMDDAVTMSGLLGREVTGVDMIIDRNTGQHYFLEANNMPQLSTGSFVDEKAAVLNRFFEDWVDAV